MATITERDGYHTLSWTDPDTDKRHRLSLGKVGTIPKRDLDSILTAKQYEISTGARLLNAHRRPAPRFEDFVKEYLLWHRAEYPSSHWRTEQIVYHHLLPEFGLTPLNLVSVKQAEDWKTKRRFAVRPSTVTKELRVLQAIFNRAVALKVLTDNPISIVKPPQNLDSAPHHWYSTKELASIYQQSNYGPIWKLFANTGMRLTEALNLQWSWIMPDRIRILSTSENRTKDAEWRDLPMTEGVRAALWDIEEAGDYVLPRIVDKSLSRAFKRDASRAGLVGSLKSLRHSFVCHMLLNKVPMRTVQLYAGHASITTTEIYAYQVLREDPAAAIGLAI